MKRSDVLLLAVCAFASGVLSLVLVGVVVQPSKRETKVEIVEKITSEFTKPSDKYFNAESHNPTQQIQIDSGTNEVRFGQ